MVEFDVSICYYSPMLSVDSCYPLQSGTASDDVSEQSFRDCIVPRKRDSAIDIYHGTQTEYIEACFKACMDLITLLKDSQPFQAIFEAVGLHRNQIASQMKSEKWKDFGVPRKSYSDRFSTDLFNEYALMAEDLRKISEDDATMDWEFFGEEDSMRMGFRLCQTFEGRTVKLSKYIFSFEEKNNTIAHTYPEQLDIVKRQCTHLYDEVMRLDSKQHAEEIKKLIAQLHWWMAQGMLWKRGSASCTEIMIAALTIFKFGKLTPYKIGAFADRIALASSCDEFVQIYSTLRE